jgi:uncharacterized membrane protein
MREFLQKRTNLELRAFLSAVIALIIGIILRAITDRFYVYQEAYLLWSWNGGVAFFLISTFLHMRSITNERMRRHIRPETITRGWILGILIAASCGSLLAIISLLLSVKAGNTDQKNYACALSGLTLVLSWLMLHTVFTLEYAYQYYLPRHKQDNPNWEKLEFPHEKNPNYWDFLYFSVGIGMASQVADVQINEGSMRRLVLFHSMISFFFNTAILATSINIIASAISTTCPPNK